MSFPWLAVFNAVLFGAVLLSCSSELESKSDVQANDSLEWNSFLSAEQLAERLEEKNLLLIDVRSAEAYRAGHLPGAINLPGETWRTPKANPGEGDSQYIFLNDQKQPDVAKYEAFLSAAGVENTHEIVIYGNHAGKSDGTIPAMILSWLGHENVSFLNGIGVEEWKKLGFELAQNERTLPPSDYRASAKSGYIWDLQQVIAALEKDSVVFVDTRSEAEYTGEQMRKNARGGHIPGAVLLDYAQLLDSDTKRVLPAKQAKSLLEERGITPEKTVVLYCQTSTRVSLHALALKDLGYENVVVYDASWHEYGNREDTPIAQ